MHGRVLLHCRQLVANSPQLTDLVKTSCSNSFNTVGEGQFLVDVDTTSRQVTVCTGDKQIKISAPETSVGW